MRPLVGVNHDVLLQADVLSETFTAVRADEGSRVGMSLNVNIEVTDTFASLAADHALVGSVIRVRFNVVIQPIL